MITSKRIQTIIFSAYSIIGILSFYLYFSQNNIAAAFIPFLVPALFLFFLFPDPSILLLFFVTFFTTRSAYSEGQLNVDLTDLFAFYFMFAITIYFVFQNKFSFLKLISKQNKKQILILIIFLTWALFVFCMNLTKYDSITAATSLWYLTNIMFLIISSIFFLSINHKLESIVSIVIILMFFESIYIIANSLFFGDSLLGTRGSFNHHGMVGNMMSLGVTLCIYRVISIKKMLIRFLYAVLAFLFLFILVFSSSRSTLLGLFAALFIFVILHLKKIKIKTLVNLSIVLVVLTILLYKPLSIIIQSTISSDQTGSLDLSSIGRLLIWKGTLNYFLQSSIIQKIVGIGIGTFITVHFPYYLEIGRFTTGAHNNFLHVFIELGVVGLIIFLMYFTLILYYLFKCSKYNVLSKCYFYLTIAFLISGLTQETFWFQSSYGNFWMLYNIFLVLSLNKPKDNDIKQPIDFCY